MQKLLLSFILTLCCCAANAQIFYSLEICRQAYEKRMYETILPSLLHIKNEAENGGKFDAQEYFSASDLLCRIYTDYYKNPEFSARIMEDVYQTLAMTAAILRRYILQHTDCQKFTDRFTVMTCPRNTLTKRKRCSNFLVTANFPYICPKKN